MAKKVQVPVVGGIRKVVQVQTSTQQGTALSGFEGQTLTVAQLQALLGVQTQQTKPNTQGSSGSTPSLVVGPGLSGGGQLLGAVPLSLIAPIPAFIFGDDGGGGGEGEPGPPGVNGAQGVTGAQGPAGPAVFLSADDGEDGWHAVPGPVGPTGAVGATGLPGITVWTAPEDQPTEMLFVAPPSPLRTVNKGAAWVSSSGAISAGSAPVVYVNCPVSGTIRSVKLLTAGGPGSCVVDIWKAPFASFPPISANSITAAAKPTISGGVTYSDSTLTGWTTTVNAGDVLAFSLSSASTFTSITAVLEIQQ